MIEIEVLMLLYLTYTLYNHKANQSITEAKDISTREKLDQHSQNPNKLL